MINEKDITYDEIFDHTFKVVSSERFLNKQGIGNEVPFFIVPFKPEDALKIEDDVINLINRLNTEK